MTRSTTHELVYARKGEFEALRTEVERLFTVVDQRLAGREWICSSYSIVDIAHFGWFHCIAAMHFDLRRHPHLSGWYDRMAARPAVARGVQLPSPLPGWDAAARRT